MWIACGLLRIPIGWMAIFFHSTYAAIRGVWAWERFVVGLAMLLCFIAARGLRADSVAKREPWQQYGIGGVMITLILAIGFFALDAAVVFVGCTAVVLRML